MGGCHCHSSLPFSPSREGGGVSGPRDVLSWPRTCFRREGRRGQATQRGAATNEGRGNGHLEAAGVTAGPCADGHSQAGIASSAAPCSRCPQQCELPSYLREKEEGGGSREQGGGSWAPSCRDSWSSFWEDRSAAPAQCQASLRAGQACGSVCGWVGCSVCMPSSTLVDKPAVSLTIFSVLAQDVGKTPRPAAVMRTPEPAAGPAQP